MNFEDFADGDDAVGDRIRAQVSALVPEDAMDEIVLQVHEHYRKLYADWQSTLNVAFPGWMPDMPMYDVNNRTFARPSTGDAYTLAIGIRNAFQTDKWDARYKEAPNSYVGWTHR